MAPEETLSEDEAKEVMGAEETGHKPPKSKQVSFEGSEVEEHEEEEPEKWKIHSAVSKLAKEVDRVLRAVKDFSFVNFADLQIVTTNKDKKGRGKKDWHVFAEIMKPKPIFQAIAEQQNTKLGPFVIMFRPAFFQLPDKRQELTIIHELYHLRFNENNGGSAKCDVTRCIQCGAETHIVDYHIFSLGENCAKLHHEYFGKLVAAA